MTSATRNRLVTLAVILLAVVGMVLYNAWPTDAQTTATANPPTVNATNPEPVKLEIKKQNGQPDPDRLKLVKKVRVGGQSPRLTTTDPQGNVTFQPPANLAGTQKVDLLDDGDKPVTDEANNPLTLQLTYAAPTAMSSPTPDINWIEKFNAEARRNNLANKWWYTLSVFIIFVGLAVPFVVAITKGILRSRATFRTATGLPVGSFRAILAYTLVIFLGFYVLISLLAVTIFPPPEFLLGIVATVVGFYFGSRSGEEGGIDTRVGAVRGIVRKGSAPVVGALVKFKSIADNTEPYSRITDIDGRFSLNAAKPGKYKVIAEIKTPPGKGEQEVTVAEGSDQEIEITIKDSTQPGGGVPGGGN